MSSNTHQSAIAATAMLATGVISVWFILQASRNTSTGGAVASSLMDAKSSPEKKAAGAEENRNSSPSKVDTSVVSDSTSSTADWDNTSVSSTMSETTKPFVLGVVRQTVPNAKTPAMGKERTSASFNNATKSVVPVVVRTKVPDARTLSTGGTKVRMSDNTEPVASAMFRPKPPTIMAPKVKAHVKARHPVSAAFVKVQPPVPTQRLPLSPLSNANTTESTSTRRLQTQPPARTNRLPLSPLANARSNANTAAAASKSQKAKPKSTKIRVRDSLLPSQIRQTVMQARQAEAKENTAMANILPPSPPSQRIKSRARKQAIRVRDSLLPASIRNKRNLVKKDETALPKQNVTKNDEPVPRRRGTVGKLSPTRRGLFERKQTTH